jgi:transcriptional regulator with XRE-family HTH domain
VSDAPTLGAALRAAREEAGLTVEQVSAETRIRATLVRDLEADRFESSMGTVYARGHVKAIAHAIGVDHAPLVRLFDAQVKDADDEPTVVEVVTASTPEGFDGSAFAASAAALRPERRTPRWGAALATAGAVLVGLVVIGYTSEPSPPTEAALPGTSATPAPSSQPTEVRTPAPDSVASKPAVTGAQLRLRLIGGSSWVSVSNATTTLFEGILRDGEFKDFRDPSRLKVVLGNAQPVNLNCGGKDSGPAGGPGEVERYMCTAAGLKRL